jgi:hypothetical protein
MREPKKPSGARSCKSKRRYRDHAEAVRALHSRSLSESTREVKPRRAYLCPHCKGWHLTSRES